MVHEAKKELLDVFNKHPKCQSIRHSIFYHDDFLEEITEQFTLQFAWSGIDYRHIEYKPNQCTLSICNDELINYIETFDFDKMCEDDWDIIYSKYCFEPPRILGIRYRILRISKSVVLKIPEHIPNPIFDECKDSINLTLNIWNMPKNIVK